MQGSHDELEKFGSPYRNAEREGLFSVREGFAAFQAEIVRKVHRRMKRVLCAGNSVNLFCAPNVDLNF